MRADVAALYVDARVVKRFWAKVRKTDGCWEWTGSRDRKGYGRLSIGSRLDGSKRPHGAHRIAWVLARGSIPNGLSVLHHCDNPRCVRPDHLWLGTIADNNRDMFAKGRDGADPCRMHTEAARKACLERLPRGDAHYARTQPHRLARGERHPGAVLTADGVRAIRLAKAAGEHVRVIAERHQISVHSVYAVVSRRNWGHVE